MALNKQNKRRSATTTPFIGMLPTPDGTISAADRRMISGVYWGYLDTGLTLGNTGKYEDAKTLFAGEDRNPLNVLPRNVNWAMTGGIDNVDRADILATGFHAVPVNTVQALTDTAENIGSQSLGAYIAANANVPITLRSANNYLVQTGAPDGVSIPSLYACYSALGSHIGSEAALSTCSPTADLAPLKYRFQIGCVFGKTRAVDEDATHAGALIFRVPVFPSTAKGKNGLPIGTTQESLTLWSYSEGLMWDIHPKRGKIIVSVLFSGFGVDVSTRAGGAGLLLDFEDYIKNGRDTSTSNNPTTKTVLDEDPRFNPVSPDREAELLYYEYVGDMMDKRLEKLADTLYAPWAAANPLSAVFDYDWKWGGRCTNNFVKAYSRNRLNLYVYAFPVPPPPAPDTEYNANEALFQLGDRVAQANGKLPVSAQLFDFWFAASLNPPAGGTAKVPGTQDRPNGIGWLSIVESVMLIKCAMALGAIKTAFYKSVTSTLDPVHPFYSIAVAYDYMQYFDDVIKNGTNYYPPADIARYETSTSAFRVLPFYGKNSSGGAVNVNTFICCRTYNEKTLFYGGTTDGVIHTETVVAPDGRSVTVEASPYGNVVLLEG